MKIASLVFLSATVPSCSGFVPMAATTKQQQQQQQQPLEMASSSSDGFNNDNSGNALDRRSMLIGVGGILSSSLIGLSGNPQSYRAFAAETATATTREFPTFTLPNNVEMPVLALNTVGLSVDDTARACAIAAANGFRHFDFHPGKERDGVAKFLKADGFKKYPRTELFLTTKIRKPPYGTTPAEAAEAASKQIEEDLAALGSGGYVDMLMIRDSPDCEVMRAQWKVVTQALEDGRCKAVGTINFCEDSIRCLIKPPKGSKVKAIKPAVNYYYYHIGMNTGRGKELRDYCDRNDIKTFAYGAIGEPGPYLDDRILESPILKNIGDGSKIYNRNNHGGDKSTAEIAVKWVLDTGAALSVRPTSNFGLGTSVCAAGDGKSESACEEGIRKRAEVFDWNLTGEEFNKLSKIPTLKSDDNPTLFSSSGCPGERPIP